MRRVVIESPKRVKTQDVPQPKPGPGEVRLKIAYCGICGSDLHAYEGKHPFIHLPATPGHEFSGTVASTGEGVEGLKVGDRVTCEPNLVCGECYNCRRGRYNICENLRVMGCQGEGAMADYFIVPAGKIIPIPEELSLKDAVLTEPLAVGVHAVHMGGDLFEKNVVIIGAGTIGLMVLVCVKNAGAKRIVVMDLSDRRLELASRMGAAHTINAGTVDAVGEILGERHSEGIDVVFECVGAQKSIRDGMALVRKGGRIVVCGVFEGEATVRMADLQDRELELLGTLMYTRRDFCDAVDLLAAGKVQTDLFLTSEYSLEEAGEAFAAAQDRQRNMKVIFSMNIQ